MTDELERIRSLREPAPGPSAEWVDDTRAELLAMAAEEEHADAAAADPREVVGRRGPLAHLRGRLSDLFGAPPPIAWAGAAATGVAAVAVVAVLGQDPDPPPVAQDPGASTAPTEAPDDVTTLASSCTAEDGTYTVHYPDGWHTNGGEATEACQYFDEEPIDVEPQTGGAPERPVVVEVVPVAFEQVVEPGRANEELSREETTVAGRDAVRATWESTGRGAAPEGMRSYRYVVDLGDRTLLLVAHDLGSGSFEQHRRVLDTMAERLELDGTG